MRLASFLIISAGLHGAFAVCPTPFPASPGEQLAPVVLISLEEARSGPESRAELRDRIRAPAPRAKARENVAAQVVPPASSAAAASTTATTDDFAFTGEKARHAPATAVSFSVTASGAAGGLDSIGNGNAGLEQSETGGTLGGGISAVKNDNRYTRARYRDGPKPTIPESARRAGKQGQVFLRVLVNEQGRSAAVEVNRSSGDTALDKAAVEAVERWRFSPARLGDRPVESWVRIPIHFQPSDALD